MVKRSSRSEARSKLTVDPFRVVEITPVRVVEIVPDLLLVVEIVPVLVVEMVPVLVVEMVPVFAIPVADKARTNIAVQPIDLRVVMILLLVTKNVRGNLVGLKVVACKLFLEPTSENNSFSSSTLQKMCQGWENVIGPS